MAAPRGRHRGWHAGNVGTSLRKPGPLLGFYKGSFKGYYEGFGGFNVGT